MDSKTIRERYLKFFEEKGHKVIPSASLIPEDRSTLFISAGMQPLVPYLMGRAHPNGKNLVNYQRCLRTDDIEEVGDTTHHTFFEMLGNWSLGDYFKDDSIKWSYQFLTEELNLDPDKLAVTVFAGDTDAPKDTQSIEIWKSVGISEDRITPLGKKDNWWGPIGSTGPCGPDTEIFYWTETGDPTGDPSTNPAWIEIWNNVFMEYQKTEDGKFVPLDQKNVDTGMGMERITAILNNLADDYRTDLFLPIINKVEELTDKRYQDHTKWMRRITDHTRAAVFLITDGVEPSNVERGYVLRRLIRRALRYLYKLGANTQKISSVAEVVIDLYSPIYPEVEKNTTNIFETLKKEAEKFQQPIDDLEIYKIDLEAAVNNGVIKKLGAFPIINSDHSVSGQYVFKNYESYGVPPDLAQEIAEDLGLEFNRDEFDKAVSEHQEKSRSSSAGMFKGGLQSQGEIETKYHTATHLLHAALRQILGNTVIQRGSNINSERLRFDFSYNEKLTNDQLKQVEELVNQQIQNNLAVTSEELEKTEAENSGALHGFGEKYGDKVTVYSIGNFSKEFCGGPHVENTAVLGNFKIQKEESAGSGIRRIYATLS